MFGNHLVLDAVASVAVAILYDIDKSVIKEVLENFVFAKRRFNETILGDNIIIDDYAHHPTEVKVTIKAARQKYPDKEIVAVLMIHTLSRAKIFAQEFADALNLADKAYITDIYTDRPEEGYDDVTYKVVMDKTNNCEHITLEEVNKLLKHKNAVILFMSSKAIYTYEAEYEKLLAEAK